MNTILLFIGSRPHDRSLAERMPNSSENLIFYASILVIILVLIVYDYIRKRVQEKKDTHDIMLDKIESIGDDVEEFLQYFKKQKKVLQSIKTDLVEMEKKKTDLKAILKDDGSAVKALLRQQKKSKYWGYIIAFVIGIVSKGAYDLIIYLVNSR